jgi:hypothetical protein
MHPTGVYAAVFRGTGATTSKTAMSIGTGDGANKSFKVGETISACENTNLWTGTVLDNDAGDYKEGAKSLTDTIPAVIGIYETKYTPAVALDFTHRRYASIWFKCNKIYTTFAYVTIRLYEGANYSTYSTYMPAFQANTWYRINANVRDPNSSTPILPDLSKIDAIGMVVNDNTGAGYILHLDWVSYNPQLCEVTAVYDNAALVAKTDYSASPSGVITFVTAPTNGHDITANYNYYAIITEVAHAYNWSMEGSAKLDDVTEFATGAWEEDIVCNKTCTIKTEAHKVLPDANPFTPGVIYFGRFYEVLNVDEPVFAEAKVILSRRSLVVPQDKIVNESLDMKVQGEWFEVEDASI